MKTESLSDAAGTGERSRALSVHQGVDQPDKKLFRACESIFLQDAGRPHWARVDYRGGPDLAAMHPRWADWWRVPDAADPAGHFLNQHLEALRDRA
jgi:L-gulonolactone oxidase